MTVTEIGFMQGRLSPLVGGKIQAFPADHWEEEFVLAGRNGLGVMEWTLDHAGLLDNPLMTLDGRRTVNRLSAEHGVKVASVTGDCFMQAPFFKETGTVRDRLFDELRRVLDACHGCNIKYLVFPLVDGGAVENEEQQDVLVEYLLRLVDEMPLAGPVLVFESDFAPDKLRAFIDLLPNEKFGINYDIGNSAAAGFDPRYEIKTYGDRILNVHVKDRPRDGSTVPLGEGDADFPVVFDALIRAGYRGNYILQTARAPDDGHLGVLLKYRDMVDGWLREYA